jgi:hypothetical protein
MAASFTSNVRNDAKIPVDTIREVDRDKFEYIGTAKV